MEQIFFVGAELFTMKQNRLLHLHCQINLFECLKTRKKQTE